MSRLVRFAAIPILALALVLVGFSGGALAGWTDLGQEVLERYGITEAEVVQISQGYDSATWGTHDPMRRAHFAKMAVEAFDAVQTEPSGPTFSDVPAGDIFYSFIEGAAAAGIIGGYEDGTFKPERTITRQQAAAIVAREAAGEYGIDLAARYSEEEIADILAPFSDAALVSEALRAEVAYAVRMGVLQGSQGQLRPAAPLTRLQGAVMLIRVTSPKPALTEPFTIVALPDTQIYAAEEEPAFAKQVEWVLANAEDKNIVFVTHLGDVVDDGTDEAQWEFAMAALRPLLDQDELPFSIVRGNHDDSEFFLRNLPTELVEDRSWFVDVSPSELCQAQIFTVEGVAFLHVSLQYDPTADDIAWANELLSRPTFQRMPVIVSTHDYMYYGGRSRIGRTIWEGFVERNPAVFMVLCGHNHTEYAQVDHNLAGRPVYQMLSDYQGRAFGGNGLMRLITIDPVNDKIEVKTFSPWYQTEAEDGSFMVDQDHFETGADSRFEYSVNVNERLARYTGFDFGPEPLVPVAAR
jgi:predicted phosphodiesterase